MTGLMLTALLLASGADAVPPPRPPRPDSWALLDDASRVRLLEEIARRPLQQRLLEASRRFLDTPYVSSPLGEGAGKDPDPTLRYDAVDCLTFVEETIALSLAPDPKQVEPVLRELRYFREQSYDDRNHLMEAQWLPHNVEKGFLRDVTAVYGGDATQRATKTLDARAWSSASSQALALPRERQVKGTFGLQIIPLDRVLEKVAGAPSGTIMVIVRDELPLKVTRVTHVGFLVHKGKRPYLRHAARNAYGRVVDEDLETFLTRNSKYQKWKVVGVSLYEVRLPKLESLSAVRTP